MKLEDQVVGLTLAKRLKELGVKQESAFMWEESESFVYGQSIGLKATLWTDDERKRDSAKYFAAFTVAELGEMLPPGFYSYLWADSSRWGCAAFSDNNPRAESQDAVSEADARAKMLIHLIEKGLVQP